MKQISILLLIFQFLTLPLAQASELRAYFIRDSIWWPALVVVDGKSYGPHFFTGFSDLGEAMKSNPEAVTFAERAKSQALWGSLCMWGGVGGALAYLVTGTNHDFGTYWTIFLVGFLPGVLLKESSAINTLKAINTYNGIREIAWRLVPDQVTAGPVADGGGALMSWSF